MSIAPRPLHTGDRRLLCGRVQKGRPEEDVAPGRRLRAPTGHSRRGRRGRARRSERKHSEGRAELCTASEELQGGYLPWCSS